MKQRAMMEEADTIARSHEYFMKYDIFGKLVAKEVP
jgi:hypothetical protein